ncbi:MAG TPA: glycine cleavage system protein GcvH [Elusimicrobia bacterium]|nr:glycine cleavage system protein GcvH [Elusimicrobiota bacterium]HBT61446.1 glycine cleavage system protein GcvH [Elusimicrobiota bacterium]
MPSPEKCRYTKTHEWVCLEGAAAVAGLTDHAQHEITDIVFVEPPKPGRQVKAGESCCVVESVKAAFDIYAPISGEVTAVNDAVTKDPAIVNRSPLEDGWLFKIKPANPGEINKLMDWGAYQEFLKTAEAHAGH